MYTTSHPKPMQPLQTRVTKGILIVSLQPVIHAVRDALRQDKLKPYIISNGHFFVFLDPVYLLLSSMAVLCHVIGLLQRALQGKACSTLQII